MNLLKKIFNILPLKVRLYFREKRGLLNPFKLISIFKILNKEVELYNQIHESELIIRDKVSVWHKSFQKFLIAQPNEIEVAVEFFKSKINVVKLEERDDSNLDIILICIVKNDILKLKKLIEHHRKIGITHFAILDNDSDDNTLEWLKKQKDIDVFFTNTQYTTNRREAWINRIIAYYGLNRWYLILDSDEIFVYPEMEQKSINSLVEYCEANKIYRMRSLMVDMYADNSFYTLSDDTMYIEECRYFDLNTYSYKTNDRLDLVLGGPRGRVFGQDAWLTKYPLCYFEKGDIQGKSHFLFPYNKNKNTICSTALLHYKFLPRDIQKYRKIASDGTYFNGSKQYKNYIKHIENSDGLSFMNEESQEYIDSSSLYNVNVLEKIDI